MSDAPVGSQRLRGEPPNRESGFGRVLLPLAALASAAFAVGIAVGSGGGEGSSESPPREKAARSSESPPREKAAKPTNAELAKAEERRRKKAARKGEVGKFTSAPGRKQVFGGDAGALTTYSVAVEEATGVRPRDFAADVDAALSDGRSWIGGGVRMQRVDDGQAAVRIVLGTPDTVDELCLPLDTIGQFSCRQGSQLNINLKRWLNGTETWPLSQDAYRNHVINHEMGHFLGYDHIYCPGPGERAPVMMQQTKGLEGCEANPWPYAEKNEREGPQ